MSKVMKNNEANVTVNKAAANPYEEVVFVGDSRTVDMAETYHVEGVRYIAEKGVKLDFILSKGEPDYIGKDEPAKPVKTDGYGIRKLKRLVEDKKRRAIIFNLGVNNMKSQLDSDKDPSSSTNFFDCYKSCLDNISKYMEDYNCDLYYMSVNPLNESKMWDVLGKAKSSQAVKDFNEKMENYINNQTNKLKYTYIDAYTALGDEVSSEAKETEDGGWCVTDGLHYSIRTSRKIYNICMRTLGIDPDKQEKGEWYWEGPILEKGDVAGEDYYAYLHNLNSGTKVYPNYWIKFMDEWYVTDKQGRRYVSGDMRHNENDALYYFDDVGAYLRDGVYLVRLEGEETEKPHYFRESGKMTEVVNGFRDYEEGTYYFGPESVLAVGFQYIDGKWYYFRTDTYCMRKDEFADLGENTYHFREDGELSSGWEEIDGDKYFFAKSTPEAHNGMMRKNKWIPNSNGYEYYVGADGKLVKNQWVDGKWVDEYGRHPIE